MSDIQRYGLWQRNEDGERYGVIKPDPTGSYVTYSDHVAAVKQAEQQLAAWKEACALHGDAYNEGVAWGQRDMLTRCIAAVEAIGHYSECIPLHEDGFPCTHEEVIDILRSLEEKP